MKKFLLIFFLIIISFTPKAEALWVWNNPNSITVYIEQDNDKYVMQKAFNTWTQATKGKFKFKYVQNSKDAQIQVYFVKNIAKATNSNAIGITYSEIQNGRPVSRIEISKKAPGGGAYSNDAISKVMVHEIGHAIGLDHNPDRKSVMYPTKGVKNITQQDLERLYNLYGL